MYQNAIDRKGLEPLIKDAIIAAADALADGNAEQEREIIKEIT